MIAVVTVTSDSPQRTRIEATEDKRGLVFVDWDVRVERGVLNAEAGQEIEVRVVTGRVSFPGAPATLEKVPNLEAGGRYLLFLGKNDRYGTGLAQNQFTIVGPFSSAGNVLHGRLVVQDGEVINHPIGPASTEPRQEPLEQVIAATRD